MSGKRDKKRLQRRRSDQKRQESARRERRREREALVRSCEVALEELQTLAGDVGTSPAQFAQRVGQLISGDDDLARIMKEPLAALQYGEAMAGELGSVRAVTYAEALCAGSDATSSARWWASGLLVGAQEDSRAESVASAALEALDDIGPAYDVALVVAHLRLDLDRPAEAMELAFALVAAEPDNEEAQRLLALSKYRIENRDAADAALTNGACPCGRSTQKWDTCCRPRELQVMAHLHDRSQLYALRLAVGEFISKSPDLVAHLGLSREDWAYALDDPTRLPDFIASPTEAEGVDDRSQREILALECAWHLDPDLRRKLPDDVGEESDSGAALARFAHDSDTPAVLAQLARQWHESARCGLWQVADASDGPDLWLMDILTGEVRYVSMAPEQLEGVPRWSVLAGWIVPDRGVWRSGGAYALLSPDEGDVAVELVRSMAEDVVRDMAKERGRSRRRSHDPDLSHPPPHGVLSGYSDGMDPILADLHSTVLGIALAEVVAVSTTGRNAAARVHNTDQEPMELLRAVGRSDEPTVLKERLLARPDFESGSGDRIAWKGREMTTLEAETSLAQARVWARQERVHINEAAGAESQHWIRGVVDIEGSEVCVEVNSQARLDAILVILGRLGGGDFVVERRFDPSLDLPPPSGWRPTVAVGSAEAEAVWRRHWVNEALPALGGHSPLEARSDAAGALELERLLRQFEFGADLASSRGERPLDVGQLRRDLGEDGRPFEL